MDNVARILHTSTIVRELLDQGYDVTDVYFDNANGIYIKYKDEGWDATLILKPSKKTTL